MFRTLGSLWSSTRGSRPKYAAALLALLVASALLYVVPLVPVAVIDGVLAPTPNRSRLVDGILAAMGGPAQVAARPWIPALAMVALSAVAGIATYLRGRWSAEASETIVRGLRDQLYDHVQRLPCRWFDAAETGDLLQRCTSDVETVRVFLSNQAVEIGRASVMLLMPLPLMAATDLRMTAVALVTVPFVFGFSTLFFVRVRTAFEALDEADGRLTTTLQENLTGIRVVRAFARQEHEIAKFADRNRAHRALDLRHYQLIGVFWSVSDLMVFGQQLLVVGVGVALMVRGELAVGAFFYFLTAVNMYVQPLRQMGRIVADLGKATVALGRIRQILDEPAEGTSGTQPVGRNGRIQLDAVTFAYGGAPALDRVSLTIEPRSTVAFVGASGSGKSTLVALLLRLYDPDSGAIRLDGVDLRDLDRSALRRRLAVVLQQPFLFSKSIADNLRLGRDGATADDVEEAARAACVHDRIVAFERGYATEVGERGVMLSGGQRQRIALARALLQDPDVLVLDDALSAVDTRTERAILAQLERRRGQRTTVIIAHRASTVAHADRIFVLDGGRVVESGDHRTLLARDGAYARLWRLAGGVPHQPLETGAIP